MGSPPRQPGEPLGRGLPAGLRQPRVPRIALARRRRSPVWLACARAFRAAASVDRRVAAGQRPHVADPQLDHGVHPRHRGADRHRLVINYILMPLWWWAIYDPHTQYATLNLGIYTVTSTGWALVTTALGLALVIPAALCQPRRRHEPCSPRRSSPRPCTGLARCAAVYGDPVAALFATRPSVRRS